MWPLIRFFFLTVVHNFPIVIFLKNVWQKPKFICIYGTSPISCDFFFFFARQKTKTNLSAFMAFHFTKDFVNYLNTCTLPAREFRVRFMDMLIMSQKSVVFCEVHINEPFPTALKLFCFWFVFVFLDLAWRNEILHHVESSSFVMINTSGAANHHKSNSFQRQMWQGWQGDDYPELNLLFLPQSIRSVKSTSLCMFALVCNNYNLTPKQGR